MQELQFIRCPRQRKIQLTSFCGSIESLGGEVQNSLLNTSKVQTVNSVKVVTLFESLGNNLLRMNKHMPMCLFAQ